MSELLELTTKARWLQTIMT